MSSAHVEELLALADHLTEVTGSGSAALLIPGRIRRSISTSYYALFHFLLHEATSRLVGESDALQARRYVLVRVFTHSGIKDALQRAADIGASSGENLRIFLRQPGEAPQPPEFLRTMADAFAEAHRLRHHADYDLNKILTADDARALLARLNSTIAQWEAAQSEADLDMKHAICLLMLLGGKIPEHNK